MRLRTIPPKSDLPAPQYDGIANARKLKSFIMADLFSYYAYKRFSLQHFSSDSSDEEHSLQDIRRISKQFSYAFAGTNSGTPANQLSKRIDDLLFRIIKGESGSSPQGTAVRVSDNNKQYYLNTLNTSGEGPFISVKLKFSDSRITESITGGTSDIHTDLGRLCRWITALISSARTDVLLQCVMKKQYDIIQEIFGGLPDIPEDVVTDLARFYMSLSCVLSAEMDRMGDDYEITVDESSFSSLIPGFERPPLTDNLLAVRYDHSPDGNMKQCSALFSVISYCNGFIHDTDLELEIYKARISMGFRKFNLLVVEDGHSDWVSSLVSKILRKIGWEPEHILLVSGNLKDLGSAAVMYYTGIGIEDKRSVSILASVYRDLLKIGYPDTDTVFSDFGENSNCIEMIRKMRLFISDKTISYTGDRTVFAAAVTEWLKSLDKVL